MKFDELSQRVIGCALEVHPVLGPSLLESTYEHTDRGTEERREDQGDSRGPTINLYETGRRQGRVADQLQCQPTEGWPQAFRPVSSSCPLEADAADAVRAMAKSRGVGDSELIREWVLEKLQAS